MVMMHQLATGCAALAIIGLSLHAHAQAPYPSKPIRMIVPLAAGGPSDTTARIVAPKISDFIGQSVVVDNRPGASGIIGTEIGLKSPPDGHTILLVSNTISLNPAIFRKLPYDNERDMTPVSLLATTPYLLAVHPSLPVKSVKDLIALAKARPGELNHASAGPGTGPHMAMEVFAQRSGIKIQQIVYKGGGPAMIDFLAGQTQINLTNMITAMQHVRTGRIRGLAVSSLKRSPAAPEIPTIHESGIADYEEGGQHGIVAPAGLPKDVLAKLHGSIVSAMRTPEIARRLAEDGSSVAATTPDEFRALIRRETAKWTQIAKSIGLQPQ
jgi:tripartite-type tricarboxylate transporter receptor subunit TctC